ncbi:syntaxin-32-like [Populus alba x Populus x berolinensis]|nr:syntaxin-32-like [Populus alba x Populus x berolinensis]
MMPPVKTSYRDRTQEFLSVAERLKKSFSSASNAASSSTGSSTKPDATRSAVAIQSEFNKRASMIGYGIHQTSQKLAKLAKLAKRTSVFDDPTLEIQELTAVIKQDITALNAAVVDLQLLCNSQNESGNISSDTTTHSTTVVDNLKNRLMTATKEFKEVLTTRTENLKVHENRRQLFSSTASKDSSNPFVRQRPLTSRTAASATQAPPPPWANASVSSSQLVPSKSTDVESQPLLQQQQQQMVPLQDSYMHSRAEALHNVESTIHELSNIFTQLATMVSQQGELAIRIDENMDESLSNVEGAQGQLVRKSWDEMPVVVGQGEPKEKGEAKKKPDLQAILWTQGTIEKRNQDETSSNEKTKPSSPEGFLEKGTPTCSALGFAVHEKKWTDGSIPLDAVSSDLASFGKVLRMAFRTGCLFLPLLK